MQRQLPFAPDLAVEVASPTQNAEEMAAKARRYLDGGTLLVWVVWPREARIDVWEAGVLTGATARLGIGDTRDGGAIVPGFSCPVREVFADPLR